MTLEAVLRRISDLEKDHLSSSPYVRLDAAYDQLRFLSRYLEKERGVDTSKLDALLYRIGDLCDSVVVAKNSINTSVAALPYQHARAVVLDYIERINGWEKQ